MKIFPTLLTCALLASGTAFGANASPSAGAAQATAPNSQQTRMKTCNADAATRELKGDARGGFMKDCLAGRTVAPAGGAVATSSQQRMKDCNAKASADKMAGGARKTFMSSCLKAH